MEYMSSTLHRGVLVIKYSKAHDTKTFATDRSLEIPRLIVTSYGLTQISRFCKPVPLQNFLNYFFSISKF